MQVSQLVCARGYRLGPRIGRGSYAKVKLAERVTDNKIMAAKIVTRKKAAKEFLSKFLPRELSVLVSLRHPNIVQIFEIVQTDDLICIMMEFADRGDLLEYIKRRGALTEENAGFIFAQVCQGVAYLHDNNICHRDLKCENVLLRRDLSVALSDFGFSKLVHSKDALSSTYCGSAAYASPDLLRGTPYKPFENDIWSLGCILFIMVTGQMPFYDKNTKKMMYRQLKGKVNFPEHRTVSPPCKHLISCVLQPNTDLRYEIKSVLSHQWLLPYVEMVNKGVYKKSRPTQCSKLNRSILPAIKDSPLPLAVPKKPCSVEIESPTVAHSEDIGQDQISADTVSQRSLNSADSEEASSCAVSDSASLCRMPGEACIIHHNRDPQNCGGAPGTPEPSTGQPVVNELSPSPNNDSQVSSSSLSQDASRAAGTSGTRYENSTRRSKGKTGGSVRRTSDKSPDQNFKMTIQRILQVPMSKKNYSKGTTDQKSPGPSSSGKSQSGSEESSRSEQTPLSQSGTHTSSHQSANQTPILRSALTNTHTSQNPQLSSGEVQADKTRMYQEGLVKQMRRIFESKAAGTDTNDRPNVRKTHG